MNPATAPDPALVRYLRTHLERFGADALRAKLTEEGVPDEEITTALQAAQQKRRSLRQMLPFLLMGVTGLIIVVSAAIYSGRSDKTDNSKTQTPGAAGSAPTAGAAGASLSSGANDAQSGLTRPFLGHSGYVLQLPPGYSALSDFKDQEKTVEVTYLFPKGTDPTNFRDEGIYGQLGIMRLEASPRRIPQGQIGMEAVRLGVARTLQSRKTTFVSREVQAGGLPAFIVSITEPLPLTQAFVLGSKEIYVLTAGAEDPVFTAVLESMREVYQ